jgi:hypothetical protein
MTLPANAIIHTNIQPKYDCVHFYSLNSEVLNKNEQGRKRKKAISIIHTTSVAERGAITQSKSPPCLLWRCTRADNKQFREIKALLLTESRP